MRCDHRVQCRRWRPRGAAGAPCTCRSSVRVFGCENAKKCLRIFARSSTIAVAAPPRRRLEHGRRSPRTHTRRRGAVAAPWRRRTSTFLLGCENAKTRMRIFAHGGTSAIAARPRRRLECCRNCLRTLAGQRGAAAAPLPCRASTILFGFETAISVQRITRRPAVRRRCLHRRKQLNATPNEPSERAPTRWRRRRPCGRLRHHRILARKRVLHAAHHGRRVGRSRGPLRRACARRRFLYDCTSDLGGRTPDRAARRAAGRLRRAPPTRARGGRAMKICLSPAQQP